LVTEDRGDRESTESYCTNEKNCDYGKKKAGTQAEFLELTGKKS
jgi:hypothetical protein